MTEQFLTPETIQRFAGSLLHFLWQGAAIAVAASIGLRLLHRRSAELRYAVSVGAMILMLAAPIATFIFYKETGALALQLLQLTGKTLADATPSASFTQAAATAAWTRWILLTWCIGVFVFTARLVTGWRLSHRLVKESDTMIPDSVLHLFEDLKQRLELSRPIQLLINTQIDTPMVVGCLKPAVLVPLSALTGLNEEQLTAILAHELAHIRRHDFLINILQRCVESLLFYHPGVWWLSARIRTEREHCCDDVAVRLCGDRRSYVQALVELERKRQTVPALSVAATGGSLVQRVHRILGVKTSNADWQSAAATLVFVLVWFVAGALQSSTTMQAKPALPATAAPTAVVVLPPATSPVPVTQAVNAIAAIITAQPQPPTELTVEPQAAAAKGSIQGVVTRAGSSQPVPGARISIVNAPIDPDALKTLLTYFAARGVNMEMPAPGNEEKFFQTFLDTLAAKGVSTTLPANQLAIEQFRATNTEKYSVVADAGGRFTFKDLPSGQYSLSADLEGYFGSKGNEPTAVVEAGKPADITVPLMPGATISGRVKNADGRTVSNILVTAHLITYANGKILPMAQGSQTSDDRGEYRLYWLPPGEYLVSADPVGPTSTPPPPAPPPPPPPPGGAEGPANQSAAPAAVGGGRGVVITPASPKYMKTFYPQSLTTKEARTLNVKEGEQVSGTDITLQKGATYKVSGTIQAAPGSAVLPPAGGRGRGRGAANPAAPTPQGPQGIIGYLGLEFRDASTIDIRSAALGGTVPSVGSFLLTPAGEGFTATFEVNGILPGEYYLSPRLLQAVPQGSGNFTINRVPINVRDRDITDLAMELFVGVNINGTVTVDGHAPGNATVRVALRADGNPSPTYQGIAARAVVAKAEDGTFTIPTVPPTRYRLELGAGLPPDLYIADVKQGPTNVYDTGIEVGKDAPAPLQIALRSGAGTVEGVVRDGAGKPVANATVVVIPPDPRRENRALYKTATSDATGRFKVLGVAPGGYKVFAWQGVSGGEFYNSRFLSKYEFRGKSITVAQSATVTENLTLIDKF